MIYHVRQSGHVQLFGWVRHPIEHTVFSLCTVYAQHRWCLLPELVFIENVVFV